MRALPWWCLTLLSWSPLAAQGTRADYERAAGLRAAWTKAFRPFAPEWQWLAGHTLWWRDPRDGSFATVAADGRVVHAANPTELGLAVPDHLPPVAVPRRSGRGTIATRITFDNTLAREVRLFWLDGDGAPRPYGTVAAGQRRELSTFAGHAWLADFAADDLAGAWVATAWPATAVIDAASMAAARPDRRGGRERQPADLEVRDGDVWLVAATGDRRLSLDGRAGDPYRVPRHRSPDGRYALGFQVADGEPHPIHLIESTPRDRIEPKLHSLEYPKAGDRLPWPRPRLFDLRAGRSVPIDDAPFAGARAVEGVHWLADGSAVTVRLHERGHQRVAVLAIDAATGAIRTVLEERSPTFVDDTQKTLQHWLPGRDEFLWASERDGWNHLYRIDARTGAAVPLTRGSFVVRRLDHVDVDAGWVWFGALGVVPGEDPYHEHLCRVRLDGSEFARLTDGDGHHAWDWSPDRLRFVDRWSRVDQPAVAVLRDAGGAALAELGRDDVTALLAAGFRPPERFVAKGRDGTTDIHGIVLWPSQHDPARPLPILEAIYAGPHDHHVPKGFGLGLRERALAELGFAVVQIDGMGTNWRHKAFHDVCWRNLADAGLPDRVAWIRALAAARPGLDLTRVGIFGGSAGGQNALAALLHHGDFYRAAAADCGCHDNRMDKVWWNEAWMGYPVGPWYAANSNVTHAAKLTGKLLLTVGELDRNVDPASTLQVVAALIAADQDFDLVVVPGAGHGVGESPYLVRRRQDFFVRALYGAEPRR